MNRENDPMRQLENINREEEIRERKAIEAGAEPIKIGEDDPGTYLEQVQADEKARIAELEKGKLAINARKAREKLEKLQEEERQRQRIKDELETVYGTLTDEEAQRVLDLRKGAK